MLLRRVTMQDVAREAAVHQTTVSLALRNDPRLPEKTRTRIRRIAQRLGYEPDPMLSALNFYRSTRHEAKSPPTMAFLLNFKDRQEMESSHPHRMFLAGASKQAAQIGYKLDVFYVGHDAAEAKRLERILRTRGITGVILAAFSDTLLDFQMDWSHFSAVLIESQQLGLSLHAISNHQLMITREAIKHLHRLGYRRIGLAVGAREEIYLKNAFTAGYYVELAQHPDLALIPPLVMPVVSMTEINPLVAGWVRAHGIDAVISNWTNIPDALRHEGLRIPREIVVAALDLNPDNGLGAGMRQNHRTVGERAVEQLAILMKTNQRGLIDTPNTTLIEGEWVNGPGVPARRAPARGGIPRRR